MTLEIKPTGFLTSTGLKWIAIITMVIDHIGAVLYPVNLYPDMVILRIIGRIAFPIFAFLIVEGYRYTRDVQKYGIRLLIFALLSEVPFDLAFKKTLVSMDHQNVFFTLALGLLALYIYDYLKERNGVLAGGAIFLIAASAEILKTDYGMLGVLLIVLMYAFYDKRFIAVWILVINVFFVMIGASQIQLFAIVSIIFIWNYNGKPGRRMRYLFYIIYPAHILTLYFIWRLWRM